MNHLRPTFSRTRPFPGSPWEVLRGVSHAERERTFSSRYAFALVLAGEAEIESGERRFAVLPGEGALLGPLWPHTSRTLTKTADFIVVQVDAHIVEAARRRLGLDRASLLTTVHVRDPAAAAAMLALAESIEDISDDDVIEDRLDEALGCLFAACLPSIGARQAADVVDESDVYLRMSVHARVGLGDLEALTSIDRLTLLRAFVAQVGLPPSAYHLSLRLEAARRAIDDGTSVVQAAIASGFRSQGEFTRLFRRHFSFSPDRWAVHAEPRPVLGAPRRATRVG